jgi:peptide chain release factor
MKEYMIQITSGRGPEECWRVVARVLEMILKEAKAEDIESKVIEVVPGNLNSTLLSALVLIKSKNAQSFLAKWHGTVQWISPSPFRKYQKRKNWFVGVEVFDVAKMFHWDEKHVIYEGLRASGPGGQHVNKTESAIRAKHVPSGITVVASERRSQHQNKSEAKERLQAKVKHWYVQQASEKVQDQWQRHNSLERGNAVRTIHERL